MERYYLVTNKSKIYDQYWKRQAFEDKMFKIYNIIARKYRIESTTFIPDVEHLIIKPTLADTKKFAGQLMIHWPDTFSKKRPVGSYWSVLMNRYGMTKNVPQPSVIEEFGLEQGRCKYRIFHVGKQVFCTMDCERDLKPPPGFMELPADKFTGIMKANNIAF